MHTIAFEMPNVCVASGTGWRSLYDVPTRNDPEPWPKGFWQEVRRKDKRYDIDADEKTSLFEAALAAMRPDWMNHSEGQISSFAFVDHFFRIDQYARGSYVQSTSSSELNRLRANPSSDLDLLLRRSEEQSDEERSR